jgi:hypothetical protein
LLYQTDENPKEKIFPAGSHVLTIAAKSTTKMILAWMITA